MSRRILVSKRAHREIQNIDTWWVANRELSRDLFYQELSEAMDIVRRRPTLGQRYPSQTGNVRRLLLRGTRYHLYYKALPGKVLVLSVWSAIRGRGPKL